MRTQAEIEAAARGTMTPQQMAAALINTRALPPGLSRIRELAAESRAYHRLSPYPRFWFKDWKTEERGPLPRCMPVARSIVRRGARWLFGKPLTLSCAGNPKLEEELRKWWQQNRMRARLRAIAEDAALDGGVALKFALDKSNRDRPVSFQTLSITEQVRTFYHPHDRDQLLMVRVQYPYYDAAADATFYYREEWTDELLVTYNPLKADDLLGSKDPDTYDGWVIATREKNPFGLIPIVPIRNLETDDCWGAGDLWLPDDEVGAGLYRILDRINLTYHLMDKSNQFDSEINPIFIDAEMDEEDLDRATAPGQARDIKSRDGDGQQQARVVFPPGGNGLRPAMMDYSKDLRKQFHAAAGSVEIDQAEFTNKGNLTQAVLSQLYAPMLEMTEDKRVSWGDDGLCVFFRKLARGLQNAGLSLGVTDDDETSEVVIGWPDLIPLTEDEKTARSTRITAQVGGGFLPHERGVKEISELEDRDDVDDIVDELGDVTTAATAGLTEKLGPQPKDTPPGKPGA